MPPELIEPLTQFGTAGLMGALWIWERLLSRKREKQLTEAHEKIMQQREPLRILVSLVQRNTQAFERFDQTQEDFTKYLERVHNELIKRAA